MTKAASYELPTGTVGLSGPVARPAPGQLPLRGDLAHIALAGRYLAAHYAVPLMRKIGDEPVELHLQARSDAEITTTLPAGTPFEVLDFIGDWCWGCCGPKGPAGYILISQLAPDA